MTHLHWFRQLLFMRQVFVSEVVGMVQLQPLVNDYGAWGVMQYMRQNRQKRRVIIYTEP